MGIAHSCYEIIHLRAISPGWVIYMQTSDCPEVDTFDHVWRFSGPGRNFVCGGKLFGMSNNFQMTLQRFVFVLSSCIHFALHNAIVRASCKSCHLRFYLE